MDELHQQTVSLLSFQDVPKEVFDAQVAFNLQGVLGDTARVPLEEVKDRVWDDLRRTLGASADDRMSFTLLQAPVFHGYVISAFALLPSPVEEKALQAALSGGVVVADAETQPSNQSAVESGDLLLKIQADATSGRGAWLLLAADNLRLLSRSAVASALELVAFRPGSRVQ